MHLKKGYKLNNGKYQLLNVIGEGGFSLTYKGSWKTVVQGTLGRIPASVPVCIKEYFFKDYCLRDEHSFSVITSSITGKEVFDKYKERLIKEARILSEVHHPNIVNVLEFFNENNTVYIVMEFISGYSLKQILEESGIFKESDLLKIIYKIGQALQFIHDKNILHLDIKPSNILMNHLQNPILIDFGISKRYDLSDLQETSTNILAASRGYASIEQYDSEAIQSFSPKPDIYSLGATMYYLLTGQIPTESILRSTKGMENPRNINPAISENTEKVILKAMSLNSSDRYESIMDMMIDLGYNDKIIFNKSSNDIDENTELISDNSVRKFPSPNNEDETIFTNNHLEKKSEKRKRIIWLSFIISIFTLGAGFTFIYETKKKTESTIRESNLLYEKYYKRGVEQYFKQNFSQSRDEFNKALKHKENDAVTLYYLSKIDSLSLLIQEPFTDQYQSAIKVNTPTEKDSIHIKSGRESNYKKPEIKESDTKIDPIQNHDNSFNAAVTLFSNKKYAEAKISFLKADKIKPNAETKKYIDLIDKELKKEAIDKKKEQYEIKMDFGNFVVVRKKSNNLYGAIDANGDEIIACKYLIPESSGKNKAFQRVDDSLLYDIYAPDGTLIQQGVGSY